MAAIMGQFRGHYLCGTGLGYGSAGERKQRQREGKQSG
jgi:hypothetical protein